MGADDITSLAILPDSETESLKWLRAWGIQNASLAQQVFEFALACLLCLCLITRRQSHYCTQSNTLEAQHQQQHYLLYRPPLDPEQRCATVGSSSTTGAATWSLRPLKAAVRPFSGLTVSTQSGPRR